MRVSWAGLLLLPWFAAAAGAGDRPLFAEPAVIEEVVVTGRRPGPPLWKIEHKGHVLWLFGLVDPVPRRLQWDEASVAHILSESEVLLMPPSVSASVSNPLRVLGLLRKLRRIERLPRGTTLQDVIPIHTNQALLRLVDDNDLKPSRYERLQPMHAAQKLRQDALHRAGLAEPEHIQERIRKLARKSRLPVVDPQIDYDVDAALQAIGSVPMYDQITCLNVTLKALLHDTRAAAERARAWAEGDATLLRELNYPQPDSKCGASLFDNTTLRAAVDLAQEKWLDDAVQHLARHQVLFGVLSMRELVTEDGLRARLETRLRNAVAQ